MSQTRQSNIQCASCAVCPKVEWSELPEDELESMAKKKFAKGYGAGESLFEQGEDAKGIYCIQEGQIYLHRLDQYGNETSFGITNPGATLGWRSFFAEEPHAATAVPLTKTKACLIPGPVVLELLRKNNNLALRYLRTVARDPGPRDALDLRMPLVPVRVRVINLLLLMSHHSETENVEGPQTLIMPMKRRQIASMIGAREETLSRTIAELQADGLAVFEGRKITIPDIRRLSSRTDAHD